MIPFVVEASSATVDIIHLGFANHTRASRTVNKIDVLFLASYLSRAAFGHAQEQSTVGAIFLAELALVSE
jgi:hypothetical protein